MKRLETPNYSTKKHPEIDTSLDTNQECLIGVFGLRI